MEKYSDEEVEYILAHPLLDEIRIDDRVDRFWDVNRQWVPVGLQRGQFEYSPIQNGLDKVFSRYTLGIIGQGLETEDYWVVDTKNPYFDASLSEFLQMYEGNQLPIDMTKHQIRAQKVKEIGLWIGVSLLTAFVFWGILSLILHPVAVTFHPGFGWR